MSFRIVEITKESEIHISKKQLIIEQENEKFCIPVDDIEILICIGSNIRISTMGIGILAENQVTTLILDNKYKPLSIVKAYNANSRHSMIVQKQLKITKKKADEIWKSIVERKIENQARALTILGKSGSNKIIEYSNKIENGDKKNIEGVAAREYFNIYHPGLNRRSDDPMNSVLNYGYSIIRSCIIRNLISTGLLPVIGIHHHNEYNEFNLADDLIEVWRPMVDVMAYSIVKPNLILTKEQRKEISSTLHNKCLIKNRKVTIYDGIKEMIYSYKNLIVSKDIEKLELPLIIPIEKNNIME